MTRRILAVVGTRPDAVKMAPVIRALRDDGFETRVCATGQHAALLESVVRLFDIPIDDDLGAMREGQDPAELLSRLLTGLTECLGDRRPDAVVAQGDTTTALASALASFYRRVPFFHVEAGLRTRDPAEPFPEEIHRRLVTRLADLHFAPTAAAVQALRREGVAERRILWTGNTGIDALLAIRPRVAPRPRREGERRVLVTLHRRESFGEPLRAVCDAVAELAGRRPGLRFAIPVHPNPEVERTVRDRLGGLAAVELLEPLSYPDFVGEMVAADLILTDSGGVQEEAPALGTPVLVARRTTERPEGVAAGVARLVGTDPAAIRREVERLLDDADHYRSMARGALLYGDGFAARRISAAIAGFWSD